MWNYIINSIFDSIFNIYLTIKNMIIPKKIIISIDGNIGSGKSTFLNLLKEKYGDVFYFAKEPVDEWLDINGENLLDKFYKDKERWSYTFQNYAYITRIKELSRGLRSDKQIIITERSVNTDKNIFAKMLTEDNYMSKFELDLYNTWFHHFNIEVIGQIYIRTNLNHCVERIAIRNRDEETTIETEYLTSLEKNHEEWLMNTPNVLILDGNVNFKNNKHIQDTYLRMFDNYVNQFNKTNYKNVYNTICDTIHIYYQIFKDYLTQLKMIIFNYKNKIL